MNNFEMIRIINDTDVHEDDNIPSIDFDWTATFTYNKVGYVID